VIYSYIDRPVGNDPRRGIVLSEPVSRARQKVADRTRAWVAAALRDEGQAVTEVAGMYAAWSRQDRHAYWLAVGKTHEQAHWMADHVDPIPLDDQEGVSP
jgi:hypothetical protein